MKPMTKRAHAAEADRALFLRQKRSMNKMISALHKQVAELDAIATERSRQLGDLEGRCQRMLRATEGLVTAYETFTGWDELHEAWFGLSELTPNV